MSDFLMSDLENSYELLVRTVNLSLHFNKDDIQ